MLVHVKLFDELIGGFARFYGLVLLRFSDWWHAACLFDQEANVVGDVGTQRIMHFQGKIVKVGVFYAK